MSAGRDTPGPRRRERAGVVNCPQWPEQRVSGGDWTHQEAPNQSKEELACQAADRRVIQDHLYQMAPAQLSTP